MWLELESQKGDQREKNDSGGHMYRQANINDRYKIDTDAHRGVCVLGVCVFVRVY